MEIATEVPLAKFKQDLDDYLKRLPSRSDGERGYSTPQFHPSFFRELFLIFSVLPESNPLCSSSSALCPSSRL